MTIQNSPQRRGGAEEDAEKTGLCFCGRRVFSGMRLCVRCFGKLPDRLQKKAQRGWIGEAVSWLLQNGWLVGAVEINVPGHGAPGALCQCHECLELRK